MEKKIDFEEYERRRLAISADVMCIGRVTEKETPEIEWLKDYVSGRDLRKFAKALYSHESLPICYALANDCQGIFTDSIFRTHAEAAKHLDGSFTQVRPVIVLDTTLLLTAEDSETKAAEGRRRAASYTRFQKETAKKIEAGLQIISLNEGMDHDEVFKIAGVFAEWLVANCEPGTMFQDFEIKGDDMVGHMSTGGTLRVDMENLGWHYSSADGEA